MDHPEARLHMRTFIPPGNVVYLPKICGKEGDMHRRELELNWDEANIGHVARHRVLPNEAEQVVLS